MVDQETGPLKATRSETSVVIETKLAVSTMENVAQVLGQVVTDTPASAGEPGTREVPIYRLGAVSEYAFLFRGGSPYGTSYVAQYELPRGYFADDLAMEYTKDGNAQIPLTIHALVDTNAVDAAKFGRLVAQDAAPA